ncbi:aldehyde ferredoxin oxidoreductase family protein [Desulfatiglans anilini]|uniref:aldehyde ferredoxin oxidoreductase family protein n=1 Tax=Desulfatiglans anilini TaxID=90728 RepID=UPI0003FFA7F2|nr:aldehyde ferredoxin oxidoreductase family protein [Desulfatiglans anilini]
MFGWKGRILRIDLTTGNRSIEDLSPELCREFVGGRGAGLKILMDEMDPRIDPLGPENKLIFATGPLTGTGVPAGGRFVVVSKSPLSGFIANPCCGGYFGPNLKYAGYDFLILEGKASSPVYLYIRDEQVELRPAEQLWGLWSTATEHALRQELSAELDDWQLNDLSIVCIGPGGENLVRFACIMADGGRAAGRSGLGAVMGSKNLKAIVAGGTGSVEVADVEGYRQAVMGFLDEGRENRVLYARRMYGTWSLPGRANKSGTQATRNFQEGYSKAFEWYEDPNHVRDHIRVRDEACFGCPFACSKRSRIDDPAYPGTTKGPEHESMALLGSNCGFGDLDDICRANYICNELGMDTITAGATISCAMELYESGFLPEEDLGFPMGFGNTEAMFALLHQTAVREAFGAVLAEGGKFLAERYGHPELFMGVKGMGMPAWHPQGVEIIGLQYATNNVGGSHTKATLPFYDGRRDPAEHLKWAKYDQDYIALVDSAILCWIIYHGPLWGEKLQVWLKTVTGIDYANEELALMGERIWNMERLFNLKAGLTKKDDALPKRITDEPRVKGQVVHMDRMLPEYYALRGWDEDGVPTPAKLRELGLSEEDGGKDDANQD